jgi:hypothetical protein
MIEFVLIKKDSLEWNHIWSYVEQAPINQGIENPSVAWNNDTGWMYMGSMTDGKSIIHRVIHTCHPYNNGSFELSFNGTDNFKNDIYKKFRI